MARAAVQARVIWGMLAVAYLAQSVTSRDGAGAQSPGPARTLRTAPVRLAITVDDLPGSRLDPSYGSKRILSEIVATLRAHQVRSATGFVVGARLASDPDGRAALALWSRAGYELGNHTYAHQPLEQLGPRDYALDIARMDPLLRELERESGQRARYFRYPYLAEGRNLAERRFFAQLLGVLGYELARVSVDFSDWAWGDAYARCLSRGDGPGLAALSRSYLQNAEATLAWATAAARQLVARPLPHVLLLHANLATAHNLDALLSAYERAGVQFVPLAEALSDPAYQADYETSVGNVLSLLSHASGRALPPGFVPPPPELELACR